MKKLAGVVTLVQVLAAIGCVAPDPGVPWAKGYGDAEGRGGDAGGGTSSSPPTGTIGAGGGDATGGAWDAGDGSATAALDAGGAAPASGAFLGETAPWESKPVATSARKRHADLGQTEQTPALNCQGCHG